MTQYYHWSQSSGAELSRKSLDYQRQASELGNYASALGEARVNAIPNKRDLNIKGMFFLLRPSLDPSHRLSPSLQPD